jgi:hypothetical protein
MSSVGWFARMFSRSTTKDFDASSDDETDGDEHIVELAKQKQGMNIEMNITGTLSQPEI